ncbi:outer membrane protein [Vibrio variabilis]|uniref:outer membrane protein n=1 Tax=Vibrio variabilis TaxID=990271 RepID=UPI001EFA27CE|nr:outer membrane beta-barrel protein [Vibrio variabilis]
MHSYRVALTTKAMMFTAAIFSINSNASVMVTPFIGYSLGGAAETADGTSYDISPSANLALAVEFPFRNGRMGAFYSRQDSSLDTLNLDTTIQYLQFQSSAEYQVGENTQAYIGAGLGASHTSGQWTKSHTGFAASIFGGVEYYLTKNLAINGQLRWQGTVVSNDSVSICNLPTDDQSCFIAFKTSWMNQVQTNLGLNVKF